MNLNHLKNIRSDLISYVNFVLQFEGFVLFNFFQIS